MVGAGSSTFDVIDAEFVELLGDEQFVFNGEGDGFALRAVTKGGIEGGYAHKGYWPRMNADKTKKLNGYGDSGFFLFLEEGHHGS
jgi:hypothetical protein